MSGFFDADKLAAFGLGVDCIWERDVEGEERDWAVERQDDGNRKRWLVVPEISAGSASSVYRYPLSARPPLAIIESWRRTSIQRAG
ncbi:hypothetical protein G7054_g5676 [Neopestalotiopsis clavispora]|nr:hypothetical protein G7054_g5676 [Neopestalotiopsis clavispora]